MLEKSVYNRPTENSIFLEKMPEKEKVVLEWYGNQTMPNKWGINVKIKKQKKLYQCELKFCLPTGDKKFHSVGSCPETALSTAWNFYAAFLVRREKSIPHILDWGLILL